MWTLSVLSTLFVIFFIFHLIDLLFYWKRKNVENSLTASIIGNIKLFSLQSSLGMFCDELYWKTKEKYLGFFIFGKPSILIRDLSLIKRILVKDFDNFVDRTVASNKKGDPLGTRTLFVEKDAIWKFMRSKVSSSFSSGKMKVLFPQMAKVGDNFVKYLTSNEEKSVDMTEVCPKYSIDVVTSCAFGVDENCFENDEALSREAARRIFPFNIFRGFQFSCYFISPFLANLFNMKWLDPSASDFVRNMFNDIKENRRREGPKDDFIGGLIKLQEKNTFHTDPEEVVAQAAQFFLAGFETVGSTLMYALYELANNKHIQTKLRESIRTYLQSTETNLTYESVMEVEYLSNVVNETLRKYTVLPFLDRKTKTSYYIPEENLTIDAGTNIYISLQSIHHDPTYFPDPMKFDPERFSYQNKHNFVQNSFLPFGDGPRNCIGARFGRLSVYVAIAKVIQNFTLSLANQFEEVDFDPKGFLLAPMNKINLVFHRV